MVGTKHFISHEFEDSTNAITLDGGTKMPDMHVLSDVRAREIYQNSVLLLFFFIDVLNFYLVILHKSHNLMFNEGVLQGYVKEES